MGDRVTISRRPPSPPFTVGYTCKAVDEDHPTVSHHTGWITALAERPEVGCVQVFTPSLGSAALPDDVFVHVVPGRTWATRAPGFVREVIRGAAAVDFFLVAQGGPYPALLLPWRLRRRRPVFQWKAHPYVSARMRLYARFCDDLVFTPTRSSFPYLPDKVRVVGHGIDANLFRPVAGAPDRDLVVIGRVAPIKHLEDVLQALAVVVRRRNPAPTLDVIGPCFDADQPYLEKLRHLTRDLGLEERVNFTGPLPRREVATLLPRYRLMVNLSGTAFDKVVGEAMASGVPVLTTNRCALEAIPAELRSELTAPVGDPEAQARAIDRLLAWPAGRREETGRRLRAAVQAEHGVDALMGKILGEVCTYLAGR